jgi:hypothetical protein
MRRTGNTLGPSQHLCYNQSALVPLRNWGPAIQYKPNLSRPLVKRGGHMSQKQGLPMLLRSVTGSLKVWEHLGTPYQTIIAPLVQSASARTTHKLTSMSAQAKSVSPTCRGRVVIWCGSNAFHSYLDLVQAHCRYENTQETLQDHYSTFGTIRVC